MKTAKFTHMKTNTQTQKDVDFLYSQLSERFNNVTTFKPIKVEKNKITAQQLVTVINAKTNEIAVGVFTYDKDTESDSAKWTRTAKYKGKFYEF